MKLHRFLSPFVVLSLGLAALPMAAQSETEVSDPDAREIITVEVGTKVLESKTLHPDGSLALRMKNATTGIPPATGRARSRKKALPTEELPNAETFYKFTLAPQETLNLKLTCEVDGKIAMRFSKPPHPEATMAAEFLRANQAPRATRCNHADIKNVTSSPYVVYLILQGQANYPYKLEIERSGTQPIPQAS